MIIFVIVIILLMISMYAIKDIRSEKDKSVNDILMKISKIDNVKKITYDKKTNWLEPESITIYVVLDIQTNDLSMKEVDQLHTEISKVIGDGLKDITHHIEFIF